MASTMRSKPANRQIAIDHGNAEDGDRELNDENLECLQEEVPRVRADEETLAYVDEEAFPNVGVLQKQELQTPRKQEQNFKTRS